jgi:phospholipase/carboxylesterase
MKHIVQENNPNKPWFVLLHGTGASERDLIPLATMIDEEANYVGVLGEVRENGMPRFFKRFPSGEFDIADLEYRTKELHEFLMSFFKEHNIQQKQVILLGYSNGANMSQSLLLHYPQFYQKAIILHPYNVKKHVPFQLIENTHVFIGAGLYDPICPKEESIVLKERLEKANVHVTAVFEPTDHPLTQHEIILAKEWYQALPL